MAFFAVSALMETTLSLADHALESILHSLLDAVRFAAAMQDHRDIGLGDTKFFRHVILRDSLVVHSTD